MRRKITTEQIVIWYLVRNAPERGYYLPESELRQRVPHSDKVMQRAFNRWIIKEVNKKMIQDEIEKIINQVKHIGQG